MKNKFDICLMNPPYNKNMHLKFLEKAIQTCENVVSVQPVRWLQEPVSHYKKNSAYNKYKATIAEHISGLDIFSQQYVENEFSVGFTNDIAIYVCDKQGGYDFEKLSKNSIIDKVVSKMPSSLHEHIEFSVPKLCVVTSLICGGNGGRSTSFKHYFCNNENTYIYDDDGKRLDNGLTFEENRKKTAWGNVQVRKEQMNIKFKTIEECKNFIEYTRTDFFAYIFNKSTLDVHVQSRFLPFMNDYSHEWTNDMLYEYFGISDKEQKEIETYIQNIKEKYPEFYEIHKS